MLTQIITISIFAGLMSSIRVLADDVELRAVTFQVVGESRHYAYPDFVAMDEHAEAELIAKAQKQ
ncbi:MAG: hypothetical protein NTV34_05700 [Proteobacteria bacterium]|nr:hypothetical protein [Pseudomonadota bacterium]